mmetsp:Transcript_7349/g.14704  ORF Transcript_7349/g.14704 Transcript_7349/m.14704 type:complete len:208 (+) Transcript_7349:61-684(+)
MNDICLLVHVRRFYNPRLQKGRTTCAALKASAAVALAATHARVGELEWHAQSRPQSDHIRLAKPGLRQHDIHLGRDDARELAEALGEGERAGCIPHSVCCRKFLVLGKVVLVETDRQLRAAVCGCPRQRKAQQDQVSMRHWDVQPIDRLEAQPLSTQVQLLRRRHALEAGTHGTCCLPLALCSPLCVVCKQRHRRALCVKYLRDENS